MAGTGQVGEIGREDSSNQRFCDRLDNKENLCVIPFSAFSSSE